MNWNLILSITFTLKDGLLISISPVIFIVLITLITIGCILRWRSTKKWGVTSIKINLFHAITAEIKPNPEIRRVAHQVLTELQTRKAALPFDKENDVITEIYDSWYSMFQIIRELVKSLPAEDLKKDKNTAELANLLISVLNQGLRPHLTRWHARFRKWIEKNPDDKLSPQKLQKKYPQYHELIKDLEKVNVELRKFSDSLRELIYKK